MSTIQQKLNTIAQRVRYARDRQSAEENWLLKLRWATQKWFWMLGHEYIRDDVTIRAQSLSFLMIFSLLPIVAGSFFIFTFLSQFGLVQASINSFVESLLNKFPYEHREIFSEYLQHFRDMYLANLMRTSSVIGIFSLAFLLWVGLKAFSNIEATLNFIWSSDSVRPIYEKIRNFIVIIVIGPIVLVGTLSIPLILEGFPVTRVLFDRFPMTSVLMAYVLPVSLLFAMFVMLFRFGPIRHVRWRCAITGAVFSTIGIVITQNIMRMYFQWGTNTVYGIAAAIPLIGFWIYAVWIVVILGAEVSFLTQNQNDIFVTNARDPAMREGQGLLVVLAALYQAFHSGAGPVSLADLRDRAEMPRSRLMFVLDYLKKKGLITECVSNQKQAGPEFALLKDISGLDLGNLLRDYFKNNVHVESPAVDKIWSQSLDCWTTYFSNVRVSELIKTNN